MSIKLQAQTLKRALVQPTAGYIDRECNSKYVEDLSPDGIERFIQQAEQPCDDANQCPKHKHESGLQQQPPAGAQARLVGRNKDASENRTSLRGLDFRHPVTPSAL